MYEAYFTKRLLEALTLADQAADAGERSVHLQASRYYRDLLDWPGQRLSTRHPVHVRATIRHGTRLTRVTVSDLSTGGFRTSLGDRLLPGTPVALQMDGLAPLDGFVVWQDGDEVGCRFAAEIHPALVDAAIAVGGQP